MSTKRITRHDENAHHIYGYVIVALVRTSTLEVLGIHTCIFENHVVFSFGH